MKDDKVIVVFGGSFNPPLNSHFSLAEQIISEYKNVEKVIFVPVSEKYEKEGLLNNKYRYEMLKCVCDKNEKFEVSDIELRKERQPFTIETLDRIQEKYQDKTIWFTTGSDNLKELNTWEKSDELVKKFKVLVLERDDDCLEEIINNNKFLKENENSFVKVKNNIRSSLSSSFVREKIREGKSIRYFTPDEVYSYIKTNNLFKDEFLRMSEKFT
ncbi:MAG TPA: nicotinate (nicotinamide) nucleotide adenylyltransferase [Clostridiaceae bacterium]|jgi:nicotinate-nucleotide adenylyltransferase|nr:nicotinate (nicotinamide) nucleotide adenylyltransferase [Clostridium sp.]MEE0126746.1 nicotinate (nicotinamide) nucleotide adenylyltransferase [Clostridia bacterium]HJJ12110.1 nicotinate (nicotinamide) nucleotide adenylyltransferase [Clostridiaceae bacterium]